MKYIPYAQQWIEDDDIEEVSKVLKGDWLTTGPKVDEFEEKFANFAGSKYSVAVSSGTAALHAAAFAAGIDEGDEAIVSPMTFAASANCILYQGGRPVFTDIDKKTYNIDPEKIEEKINDDTKAIVPVDYTGQPCEMDKIMEMAKENDLTVIEDSSHAVGATYKGKKIGSIADMSIFSFHPVKHIATGEGGMITTDSKELYDKLRQFRTHGITKDEDKLIYNEGPWFYEQQFLGYNYRLTDMQCALGISQLKKIDKFLKRRREIADQYTEFFKDLRGIIRPYQDELSNSAWHLYVIQLELEELKADRKKIFNEFLDKKLGVQAHYIPVYYHPYYQNLGYERGLCPNAEWLYDRIISIPMYPKMKDEDVKEVVNRIESVIKKYQK